MFTKWNFPPQKKNLLQTLTSTTSVDQTFSSTFSLNRGLNKGEALFGVPVFEDTVLTCSHLYFIPFHQIWMRLPHSRANHFLKSLTCILFCEFKSVHRPNPWNSLCEFLTPFPFVVFSFFSQFSLSLSRPSPRHFLLPSSEKLKKIKYKVAAAADVSPALCWGRFPFMSTSVQHRL